MDMDLEFVQARTHAALSAIRRGEVVVVAMKSGGHHLLDEDEAATLQSVPVPDEVDLAPNLASQGFVTVYDIFGRRLVINQRDISVFENLQLESQVAANLATTIIAHLLRTPGPVQDWAVEQYLETPDETEG